MKQILIITLCSLIYSAKAQTADSIKANWFSGGCISSVFPSTKPDTIPCLILYCDTTHLSEPTITHAALYDQRAAGKELIIGAMKGQWSGVYWMKGYEVYDAKTWALVVLGPDKKALSPNIILWDVRPLKNH